MILVVVAIMVMMRITIPTTIASAITSERDT
jgi:hypothetical protein